MTELFPFLFQVHIINLLQDSKFHHFKPVMDTYIESHFAGALSYRCVSLFLLLGCIMIVLRLSYGKTYGILPGDNGGRQKVLQWCERVTCGATCLKTISRIMCPQCLTLIWACKHTLPATYAHCSSDAVLSPPTHIVIHSHCSAHTAC